MKKQRIELQTALQTDEMFLAFLTQEAQSEKYCRLREHAEKTPDLTGEKLYDYVLGWLDEKEAREVREHIALCGDCAHGVVRIMRIEDELEQDSLDWADVPPAKEDSVSQTTSEQFSLTDRVVRWLSSLWEPQWAGQLVTAADIPQQSHTFTSEDGDMKIACYWKGQYKDEPAYVQISWKADLIPESELWIRFVNPATRTIRREVCLGTGLVGEEIFTSDDLGFDPSYERWAIAVLLV